MKSKTSATTMMKTTVVSTGWTRCSGHLEDDSLDHVRHVLAAVGDGFERLIDLLPLDHLDRVRLLVEHRGEALPQQAVGADLEPVQLHCVLLYACSPTALPPNVSFYRSPRHS